jgi:hypothetical protein
VKVYVVIEQNREDDDGNDAVEVIAVAATREIADQLCEPGASIMGIFPLSDDHRHRLIDEYELIEPTEP